MMDYKNPDDGTLKKILKEAEKIAIVGASAREDAISNKVMRFLLQAGYTVYPVNPNENAVCGENCYPSLADLPAKPDIVNVFRRSEFAVGIVKEAAKFIPVTVWMQEGVHSAEATQVAAEVAGMTLVSDCCIMKTHQRIMQGL